MLAWRRDEIIALGKCRMNIGVDRYPIRKFRHEFSKPSQTIINLQQYWGFQSFAAGNGGRFKFRLWSRESSKSIQLIILRFLSENFPKKAQNLTSREGKLEFIDPKRCTEARKGNYDEIVLIKVPALVHGALQDHGLWVGGLSHFLVRRKSEGEAK